MKVEKFFLGKNTQKLVKNPHIWAIIAIFLFLVLIYTFWPWREWKFSEGIGQWFAWLSPLDYLALFELRYNFTGSLFIFPIIYATIAFKWLGALIVSVASLAYAVMAVGLWATLESILVNSTLLLAPAAVIVAVTIELELRRRDRRVFTEREEERKIYLSKMHEAQEKERQRLAQELHDDTVQTLLAVASYAEALSSPDEEDIVEMKKTASWIGETTRRTVEDLRRLSLDLRPGVLDNLGLIPALKWLVKYTKAECKINIRLVTRGQERKLEPSIEVIVFRIIQEALNNIRRHSEAKKASITLDFKEESLKITVQDDGRGFVFPKRLANLVNESKLGLVGMQERVKSLEGNFDLQSEPGIGTLLSIEIPLPQ